MVCVGYFRHGKPDKHACCDANKQKCKSTHRNEPQITHEENVRYVGDTMLPETNDGEHDEKEKRNASDAEDVRIR